MYRLEREEYVKRPYMYLWGAMAFQAGYLNAFGFLACGRYVSHVTGFGSQIGVAMAQNRLFIALEFLGFPLFFILGSFFNAVLTAAPIERHEKPHFVMVTRILCGLILVLLLLGHFEFFGHFANLTIETPDFVLLYLLSFLCGMQNGCFAVLTRGSIRTTHLTGISTDIGTDLARTLYGKLTKVEYGLTARNNWCRLITFVSFATGSVLSVLLSQRLEYWALLIPLATSVLGSIIVTSIETYMDEKFGNLIAES